MNRTQRQKVEQLCQQRGVRLTPQRLTVLELIVIHQGAISAYDLLEQLKKIEPQAKPPTIYRALDFLVTQGFVHKVESINSYISCCMIGEHAHFSQLFICRTCDDVVECHDIKITEQLTKHAEQIGFSVENHIVETHGTCKACIHSDNTN